ncbi:hypothetical protein EVAR_11169_1 [Eumeta japonica]|uniref:Uncharacterized protein n=1 Tax=Eumeta variegata TaxID=151549 RepID=A0A4C1U4F2_EUMVA|nr:hypothetical protein EVAR_11169_1 [Eumeta japonica]
MQRGAVGARAAAPHVQRGAGGEGARRRARPTPPRQSVARGPSPPPAAACAATCCRRRAPAAVLPSRLQNANARAPVKDCLVALRRRRSECSGRVRPDFEIDQEGGRPGAVRIAAFHSDAVSHKLKKMDRSNRPRPSFGGAAVRRRCGAAAERARRKRGAAGVALRRKNVITRFRTRVSCLISYMTSPVWYKYDPSLSRDSPLSKKFRSPAREAWSGQTAARTELAGGRRTL